MPVAKWFVGFVAVTALVTSATGGSAAADPVPAKPATPTIASVTAQLDALGRQSEQLAEQYNAATITLATVRGQLRSAQAAAAAAGVRRDRAQQEFVGLVQVQYENGQGSAFGTLMTSASRQAYLDRANYSALAADHAASVVTAFRQATVAAEQARATVTKLVKRARAQVRTLARAKADVLGRTGKLQTLLASLTAAQQRAYAARDAATKAQMRTLTQTTPAAGTKSAKAPTTKTKKHRSKHTSSTITVHAGNAAAQRAVDFALKQVGKPYVYAADGPSSYDCSGLTMAAWRHGGVSLPHLAAAQYNYGHHVGWNDLQPGDLIFLYSPIGHVEIYIGHGLAVSAPQPGEDVEIISIGYSRGDFTGATRLT